MTALNFQKAKGGVPFPRTAEEWQDKGMTAEQADHKMKQDVFGHDFKTDARGNPIEQGRGSNANQTPQHKMAIAQAEGAKAAMRSKAGWSPALTGAFDAKLAALDEERLAKALSLLEQHEAKQAK